jgi:hypothetical protein
LPLNLQEKLTADVLSRLESSLRDVGPAAPCGMGCASCIDFDPCGGLHLENGFFDCGELCCGKPDGCSGRMCRFNMADYARRHAEVGGLDLTPIPPAPRHEIGLLPLVAPMIYHGKRRSRPFVAPVVAVRLRDLYFRKSGAPRFRLRAQLLDAYKIGAAARIIVVGIDNDAVVERWWTLSEQRQGILHNLKHELAIDLVTVPNFSLALSWPRWSDLYSMKRIGLSWQELSAAGIASALHPNGRTDKDFERWRRFIAARPEITHLSFEFTTGAGGPAQRKKYAEHLIRIAGAARRPLHLIVMGGQAVWPQLAASFATLTIIETSIFMKTQHRQRAFLTSNGRLHYERITTAPGADLDDLNDWNAHVISERTAQLAAALV